MNIEKIAIIVDSGSDVPEELAKKYNMFIIPLKIIYGGDKEYLDNVDITPQEVYESLEKEIPTTSLPDYSYIEKAFSDIEKQGYTHVFAVTISSKLSGTHNMFRIISDEFSNLETKMIDTKNISLGSGAIAIQIAKYIENGFSFEEISQRIVEDIKTCKVFFTISTLKYLRNGGRIGKVAGFVGEALNLKPIITCDKDGVFETLSKSRGFKIAQKEMLKMAKEYAEKIEKYRAYIIFTELTSEVILKVKEIKSHFKNAELLMEKQLSPTLGVHVGPGLYGVVIQKIN